MALTYTKDIIDFNRKVKEAADVTELETTVSQLSGSLVTVQGDIATLAGAVTALDGEVEELNTNIGGYVFREISISDPNITISSNSFIDYDCGISLENDETIAGYILRYVGSPNFTITNIFVNSETNKLNISILNSTNSSVTSVGRLVFTLVTKKTN